MALILNYIFTATFLFAIIYCGKMVVKEKLTIKDQKLKLPLIGVAASLIGIIITLFLISFK